MSKFVAPSALLLLLLGVPAATSWAAPGSAARIQIVDERGVPVRDAVVEIAPSAGANTPFRFLRAAMAQKNLQFTPGTLIVQKGANVAFPNLDRVRHSIYSFSKAARFEIELYGRDQTRSKLMPVTGTVAIGCNIHDDMRGYIRVVDTPYAAKTDQNGYASIAAVPDGSAKITVWHPRLRAPQNELDQTVSLSGGLSKKIAVRLR